MDSCTFRYFEDGKLKGIMVVEVEVDDLLTLGDEAHFAKMQELQRRFKFGKFKFLDEEQQGVSFNGRRLRMDEHGTYHIDMQKFIEERLREVKLEVGRAAMKEVNAQRKNALMPVIGALTWATKEGRPDCAAAASLIAGSLNKMKVQDVLDMNKAVREAKKTSKLCLKIQPIAPDRMVWGVVTDASYANASGSSSQGAYGVVCADRDILQAGKSSIGVQGKRTA